MRYLIIAITALVALGSCSKDSDTTDPPGDGVVSFSNAQITSRTAGDEWENLDEVGIYMTCATNSSEDRENVRYTTTDEGVFSVYSGVTPIYYPQSATDLVNFNAYYPYSGSLDGDLITIDIKEQNSDKKDQGNVDFMVASLTNRSKQTAAEKFTFYHKLSMLVLKLTHNSEISSFDDMATTIESVNTVANFDVLTGAMDGNADTSGNITFVMEEIEGTMTATAILLPGEIAANTVIKFIQGTNFYPLTLSSKLTLASGSKHIYSVVVGRDEVLVTSSSEIEDWNKEDESPLYSQE